MNDFDPREELAIFQRDAAVAKDIPVCVARLIKVRAEATHRVLDKARKALTDQTEKAIFNDIENVFLHQMTAELSKLYVPYS